MAATNEGIDAAAVESEGGSGRVQITEQNSLPIEVMANKKKVTLQFVGGELHAVVVDKKKRVSVLNTKNGYVTILSNSASSAVLNSEGKLAGHNGNQVFLLSIDGNRDVEKSHDHFDFQNTLLLKWISSQILVIVTKFHVYYWDVKTSTPPVVKIRNHRLSGSILDFSVSHDGKYGLLTAGTALLLFQMEGNSKRNTFHALAGTFATYQSSNVVLIMASFNVAGSIIVEARELGRSGAGGNKPRAWSTTIPVQVQVDSRHMNLLYCHGGRGFVVTNSGVYVVSLTSGKMLSAEHVITSEGERILCARGIGGTIHVITNDRVLSINHVEGHEEIEDAGEEQVTTVNGTISGIVGGNDSAVGAPDPTPELPDPPGQKQKTVLSSPESVINSRPRVDPPDKEDTISVSDASTEQEEKKEEDDIEAEEDGQVDRDGRELEGRNVDSPVQREPPRADLPENEADSSLEYHADDESSEEEQDETEDDLSREEIEQGPEELHPPLAAPLPAASLPVPPAARGNVTRQLRRPTIFTTFETIEEEPLLGWRKETRHSVNRTYHYFTSPGNAVMMKSKIGAISFANILMEEGVHNEEEALVLFRVRNITGLYRDLTNQ
mmetsp:Transcript_2075/g.4539  ORF Transcript_2075/g.4539 Transcript_2075/m.4539 type:complete len:608 (-) Transcript_2075:107-1930(-)